jgi:hypothetical protein
VLSRRILSVGLAVASLPVLGSFAYAAAHSVSDTPAPQRIFPASSDNTSPADNPANLAPSNVHGDDRGAVTSTHDVGDDRGGRAVPVSPATATPPPTTRVSNSGPGNATVTTRAPSPTTSTTVDDHGGDGVSGGGDNSGSGSGSGSGRGGGGADDPAGHN